MLVVNLLNNRLAHRGFEPRRDISGSDGRPGCAYTTGTRAEPDTSIPRMVNVCYLFQGNLAAVIAALASMGFEPTNSGLGALISVLPKATTAVSPPAFRRCCAIQLRSYRDLSLAMTASFRVDKLFNHLLTTSWAETFYFKKPFWFCGNVFHSVCIIINWVAVKNDVVPRIYFAAYKSNTGNGKNAPYF